MGVGGGGGNAVNRMVQTGIQGVEFWAVNTDAQAISRNLAPGKLAIGQVGFLASSYGFLPSFRMTKTLPYSLLCRRNRFILLLFILYYSI